MKLFVFSTLLAVAAAFTTQPVTGPAKLVDSPARSRTATIVHDGKANGTFWGVGHTNTHTYAFLPVVLSIRSIASE
eukprot:scaffold1506_cov179-Amphora_coffeaeformis.AAC.6